LTQEKNMSSLAAPPARGDLDGAAAHPRWRRSLWTPLLALVISAGGALAVLALGLLLAR
jgi:hypothetical protein